MLNSKVLSIGFAIIGIISVFYLSLLYIPILAVEARYQSLSLIESMTGKRSFESIIIPEFDFSDPSLKQASIEIPQLFIHEPIIFDVDPTNKDQYSVALKTGIAHAQRTGHPGAGSLGYYFAHSSNAEFRQQFNAVFYLLNKLEIGNTVYIWKDGQQFSYTVTEKRITNPSDVSFVTDVYNDETIVLQTCWPPGTTTQRLLVFAEKN